MSTRLKPTVLAIKMYIIWNIGFQENKVENIYSQSGRLCLVFLGSSFLIPALGLSFSQLQESFLPRISFTHFDFVPYHYSRTKHTTNTTTFFAKRILAIHHLFERDFDARR